MSETLHVVQPDSRGRMALRSLIERGRSYTARRQSDGSVVLTPIAHVLSEEAYQDLQTDPSGYASMLARARAATQGAPAVSPDEFWALVDSD